MTGRRAIVGLCMLCALLVSAFAAQSASAVTKGTTAFTCVKGGGNHELWGEHCLSGNPGNGEKQEWGHVPIAENTTTHAVATNEKTANGTTEAQKGHLDVVVGGVKITLTATGVSSAPGTWPGAWLENKKAASGEHYIKGEGTLHFTGVTVSSPLNCKVVSEGVEGTVKTAPIAVTTEGQGDNVLLKPAEGTSFATFSIVNNGGVCAAAMENIKIIGSIKGQPDSPSGATTTFNLEKTQGEKTLHFGSAVGPAVGIEGKLTIKAGEGKEAEGKPTNPISATTVETP